MVDKEMLEALRMMMQEELKPVNERLDAIDQRMTKMEIHQENVTDKNIQLLIEGQQGMNEKFRKLDKMAEDVEEIKVKVSALEETSKSQASQIKELRIAK